ncbi:MAG: NADH-quinone oxidoreductase subunit NuoH [Alphaproteobacteria bacterium]|nr:NADH-quinone oxidoreductase subunit NuoH [Alphaproteobacteria bacterium]
MSYPWAWALSQIASMLVFLVCLLVMVAFILLYDRKIFAAVQMRRGPNVVGIFGLLQSFADLGKYLIKEVIIPAGANKVIFLLAPLVSATLAFAAWAVIPMDQGWVFADINVGILYLFAVSSLGVYGIIMAGWASNSKYAFLSACRAAAQMVSYEVSIGFVLVTVLLFAGSLNLSDIVRAQTAPGVLAFLHWNWCTILFPMLPIFFVSAIAETNRPPFDLVEAESELVAGYFVEYSSTPFLLFYLAEFLNICLMSAMLAILFFGGWQSPLDIWPLNAVPGVIWLVIKIWFFFFLFAMVRAFVPRYRYDQLMRLGWKVFLPTTLVWVLVTAAWVVYVRHGGA